ncbi:MAG: CehA/McbA family metallohydrolase [Actinomycetales bacterium]
MTVRIDVLATQTGPDSWLEMLVGLSRRPPAPGRPPSPYQISYRFRAGAAAPETHGTLGVVWVPVEPGSWTSVVVNPQADISALWPDIASADNSFSQLWLGATSRNGAPAGGYFDYLTFQRADVGNAVLGNQRDLMTGLRTKYPGIVQMQGLEVSYFSQHLNWYGGGPAVFDSSTWTKVKPHSKVDPYVLAAQQAGMIHNGGGLASLNHPFGTGFGTAASAATRHTVVAGLLAARPALDMIEVGYAARGADLRGHLDLWDTLLRNGLFLPGIGVSDDHQGEHGTWTRTKNRFATCAWTTGLDEMSLVTAIAGGRTYCRELGTTPTLDLSAAGGSVRMGEVLVDGTDPSIDLRILATGLPSAGAVRVVQGAVEFGSTALDPSSATTQMIPAGSFSSGEVTASLDNSRSSFARVEVIDEAGRCIAFSNPVWLLRPS